MCLHIVSKDADSVKFVNGKMTCYKVLRVSGNSLISPYRYFKYKGGWNIAQKEYRSDNTSYYIIYDGAIHVCTSYKVALEDHCYSNSHRIVKVTCYKKDFIAKGANGDLAFKKIWLPKIMIVNALKSKRKLVQSV